MAPIESAVIQVWAQRVFHARWAGIVFVCLMLLFPGCSDRALERPVGYFRLGKASELAGRATYFPEQKVLLRHDAGGFYAMSTACTYDLTPLERHDADTTKERWVSPYTTSQYDAMGLVLQGPTTRPLPYYDLRLDAGVYGGVPDTLFVRVGEQRSREWRLKVD